VIIHPEDDLAALVISERAEGEVPRNGLLRSHFTRRAVETSNSADEIWPSLTGVLSH
jgi:hypothetical protein